MSAEVDIELRSLDARITGYVCELYAYQQAGLYKGFSPYVVRFCALLCARDCPASYTLVVPKQGELVPEY